MYVIKMILKYIPSKINMNVYYRTMDEIRILMKISMEYSMDKFFDDHTVITDELIEHNACYIEHYDDIYRICYEAATNFINKSSVFSELKPEEIIQVFANMKIKDDRILISKKEFIHIIMMHAFSYHLKLYEKLLRINKEMLLALIKAINDKKITHEETRSFIDDNGIFSARSGIDDNELIRLYRILLEYNNFDLDNLNLKPILNDIRSPITKRAIK